MLDRVACCPTCRRPMDAVPSVASLSEAVMDTHQRMIVAELAKAYPRSMTAETIADAIYRHRVDGGPESALQVVRVLISRLRRILPEYGWTISGGRGGRGNVGHYRLEPAGQVIRRTA